MHSPHSSWLFVWFSAVALVVMFGVSGLFTRLTEVISSRFGLGSTVMYGPAVLVCAALLIAAPLLLRNS